MMTEVKVFMTPVISTDSPNHEASYTFAHVRHCWHADTVEAARLCDERALQTSCSENWLRHGFARPPPAPKPLVCTPGDTLTKHPDPVPTNG